ncbi:MAG: hypothetical protein IJY12_04990 [Clostridia bacterium]|nr:hypothetical protein [Clostridia bacterium]
MDTIKIEGRRPKMIAHRGLSGIERENTYPAFVAAGNRSYYGIETDVHVTADGQFVIIHDETTGRVSLGANDINVEASPFDAVKDVVLPDLDGSTARRDIRIPLLADYVAICKKYGKKCVLELKNRMETADIAKMIELIKALDYLENVIFISFSYENCADLRAFLPDAAVQFLTSEPMSDAILERLTANRLDLDIYYPRINGEWIEKLHALGIKVNVWTCDTKEHAEALAEMGVDFITSNILE